MSRRLDAGKQTCRKVWMEELCTGQKDDEPHVEGNEASVTQTLPGLARFCPSGCICVSFHRLLMIGRESMVLNFSVLRLIKCKRYLRWEP